MQWRIRVVTPVFYNHLQGERILLLQTRTQEAAPKSRLVCAEVKEWNPSSAVTERGVT